MAIYKLKAQGKETVTDVLAKPTSDAANPALQSHDAVIIELIAASLEYRSFISVTHALVNELCRQLECERVSLKLNKHGQQHPHAISSSAGINPDAGIIKLISDSMNEALDQKSAIVFPSQQQDDLLITSAHEKLANSLSPKTVCTVLLTQNHEIIGALTLERKQNKPFDAELIHFCQRVALLVGPLLVLKFEEEHWLLEKAWGSISRWWKRIRSSGYYTEKTAYGLGLLLAVFLIFVDGTHRITGDAILEGSIQRMITAPIDGYIAEVHVRAGDLVKDGQLLASLDDKELQLQQMKLKGEFDRYSREYRDARAKYDLTEVAISGARMQQARAELDIVKEQLRRLQMKAPFDGVVVEGKLEQALGSPVEQGQVLLKVAPLNDYRIILKVDDRDIAWVNKQQTGKLILASLPDEVMNFTIKSITPVSIAEDGRNYFKLHAQLEEKNSLLRPGMHGVGKIEVGERRLMWIWFHRFTDWLRYSWWAW